MAISLEFLSEAREEFDQAFDWYAVRSQGAAIGFASAVEAALDKIVGDPKRFAKTYVNCRYCALQQYPFCVVYYLHENHVTVVAVAHKNRSQPAGWSFLFLRSICWTIRHWVARCGPAALELPR